MNSGYNSCAYNLFELIHISAPARVVEKAYIFKGIKFRTTGIDS